MHKEEESDTRVGVGGASQRKRFVYSSKHVDEEARIVNVLGIASLAPFFLGEIGTLDENPLLWCNGVVHLLEQLDSLVNVLLPQHVPELVIVRDAVGK